MWECVTLPPALASAAVHHTRGPVCDSAGGVAAWRRAGGVPGARGAAAARGGGAATAAHADLAERRAGGAEQSRAGPGGERPQGGRCCAASIGDRIGGRRPGERPCGRRPFPSISPPGPALFSRTLAGPSLRVCLAGWRLGIQRAANPLTPTLSSL